MNINKAIKRDRKIKRRRYGHKVDGKSIFTIQEKQKQRAEQIKRERERIIKDDHYTDK